MNPEERRAASLRRSAQAIARADATLAVPRPEGPLWEAPAREKPAPPATRKAEPQTTPTASWAAWVDRRLDRRLDVILEGTAHFVMSQRRVLVMRHIETERRLAALEAKIEELTG